MTDQQAQVWRLIQENKEQQKYILELERQLAHCRQAATALAMLSDDETITEAWFPDEENDDD